MIVDDGKLMFDPFTLTVPWEHIASSEWTKQLLMNNIPMFRSELLKRLLASHIQDIPVLEDELTLYGIPFEIGDDCTVLVIRLDEGFRDYGSLHDSVLEFSIENIVKEIVQNDFRIWCTKDDYGYIVFLVKARWEVPEASREDYEKLLESATDQMQILIKTYLKGKVSVIRSPWGRFPNQLFFMYKNALTTLQQKADYIGIELIIDELSRHGDSTKRMMLKKWVIRAMQYLKDDATVVNKGTWSNIVGQVQSYIRSNLSEDISLQSLSERVYLHPVYLSKLYKVETGEGLSDYISNIKMEHASELLLSDRDLKIYEVAIMVGFQNSSYFSRVFKNRFGMTPLEFRKIFYLR